jgi:hypothetical protein
MAVSAGPVDRDVLRDPLEGIGELDPLRRALAGRLVRARSRTQRQECLI